MSCISVADNHLHVGYLLLIGTRGMQTKRNVIVNYSKD